MLQLTFGQKTRFLIDPNQLTIDAFDQAFKNIKPGDTIFFNGGVRQNILIKNFQGKPGNPIVMINSGKDVIIDTNQSFGISIQNCRYFKFTGTGDPSQTYGFKIKRVANGSGMNIGNLSSDIEIDHVWVENCANAGIYASTDPDCSLTMIRGIFTQFNTVLHDNYIANVGNEGLKVGSSNYLGQKVNCNGTDVILLPGLLEGVKIYNNTIKYSGWEGISLSSASKNCQIFNNTIQFDSQKETESHMAGILISSGTKCDCSNNFIRDGKGNGIESSGLGGYRIFNNIIINAGLSFAPLDKKRMKHGIFVNDLSCENDSAFYIQHNDIINPKSDGIRFSSIKSKKNVISSNMIINPGNYDYYEKGNTKFKGDDSYIMIQNPESQVTQKNNYFARNALKAGILSQNIQSANDFKLVEGSPLIDAADRDKKIAFDFNGFPRPFGVKSDIGAFEYEAVSVSEVEINIPFSQIKLLQNPVKDYLTFSMPSESNTSILLNIYSLTGKMIDQFKQPDVLSTNQVIQVNISKIGSGMYIYTIRSGEYASSGKFIKW